MVVQADGQSRRESRAVYGAGLVQGVALVAFPASSAILTSPQYYDLSSTAYGALFLPQAAAAILAALSGTALMRRIGIKRTYLAGLVGDLVAMSLLVASQFFIGQGSIAVRDAAAGDDEPRRRLRPDGTGDQYLRGRLRAGRRGSAVLYLNALLGLGTALAPVLVAVFVGIGFWWGLPLVDRAPDRGAHRVQPAAAAGGGRPVGRARRRGPVCRHGSGSSPPSRCCTAWSRRPTATGRRST